MNERRDRAVALTILLVFSTLMALALNAGFALVGQATGYRTLAASTSSRPMPAAH